MTGDRIPQPKARSIAQTVLARLDITSRTGIEPMPFARTLFLGAETGAEICNIKAQVNQSYSWRREMHQALDGLCGLCGLAIDKVVDVTFDHVVPRARGGGNYANLLPAHSTCNGTKSDRMPTACEGIMLDVVNLRLGNQPMPGPMQTGRQVAKLGSLFPARLSPRAGGGE